MKKRLYLSLFLMACFCLIWSNNSEISMDLFPNGSSSGIQAKQIKNVRLFQNQSQSNQEKIGFIVRDLFEINQILRPGSFSGLLYNPGSPVSEFITNNGLLTIQGQQAIQKSPKWIRAELQNVLEQLPEERQNLWAAEIINAVDPYIDEIAFCIAHSSIQYLNYTQIYPQLMTENAQLLYQIDQDLAYVQIIDHGASQSDENYYSTTKYRRLDSNGNIEEVEIPKEIYYWYVVHPKTSDEIPAYIDEDVVESNTDHTNNISDSENGQFWRQSFYYETMGSNPYLSVMLDSCNVVWSQGAENSDAIHAIQNWINAVMEFNSNSERPHQPVRIYKKGIGRCGEHGDMTIAATRTALIPCTSIVSASTDHVWNEFWDGGWHHWEPVNNDINNPLVYENGWGKVFGSVFEIRSDGFLTPVTDRYSEGHAVINIQVVDNQDQPIDGASVKLGINDNGTVRFDMLGYTDLNGLCQFVVGESRHYLVHVDTPIGSNPSLSSQYLELVDNALNGQTYNFEVEIDSTGHFLDVTTIDVPSDNIDDFRLHFIVEQTKNITTGFVAWDDISILGERPLVYRVTDNPGKVNVQFMNLSEFSGYQMPPFPYSSFGSSFNVSSGDFMFNIPENFNCFGGIDNYTHFRNAQLVEGSLCLEIYSTGNQDSSIPSSIMQACNYPNPFNPCTSIVFTLNHEEKTELSVFNIKGQKIKTLLNDKVQAGNHKIIWDGSDHQNQSMPSGVYFYTLKCRNQTVTGKMLLMK